MIRISVIAKISNCSLTLGTFSVKNEWLSALKTFFTSMLEL